MMPYVSVSARATWPLGLGCLCMLPIFTFWQELFYAGSDTSTITTEWAMTEFLRNPGVMQKVRQELSDVIGAGQMV